MKITAFIFFLLYLPGTAVEAGTELHYVATLRPVHSILASITRGITTPELLIAGIVSPHDYTLRPSERRQLDKADAIFWIDDTLESFMPRVVSSLPPRVGQVKLSRAPNVFKLSSRSYHTDEHAKPHDGSFDTHIWLSVVNARAIANKMVDVLITKDPANREVYQNNLHRFLARADSLERNMAKRIASAELRFMVFHDAYQYLEHSLALKNKGVITFDHEIPPGARHIRNMLKRLKNEQIACLFYQKPVRQSLLGMLTSQTNTIAIELDPLGNKLTPGPELYFELMNQLVRQLLKCR